MENLEFSIESEGIKEIGNFVIEQRLIIALWHNHWLRRGLLRLLGGIRESGMQNMALVILHRFMVLIF